MTDLERQGLRAIAEQAADWYLRIEEEGGVPLSERQAFVRWLQASPAHVEEFLRVSAVHRQIAAMDVADLADVQAAISIAASNVVELSSAKDETTDSVHAPVVRRRAPFWAAAAAVITAIGTAGWYAWISDLGISPDNTAGTSYSTVLGEQRSVLLSDGSVIELNTQSSVRVLFSSAERRVELVTGEAIFDVTKDPDRPFRVDAGSTHVEVTGTRFNVYRQPDQTVVTVVEGQVEVTRHDTPSQSTQSAGATAQLPVIELEPGNQLAVPQIGTITDPVIVDPRKAVAWTERRLVFDGDSLATVVREVNRYNREQLVIADPALANQTISGVFNANDPATLLKFLEAVGGLQVERDVAGGWVLYPAEGSASNIP